MMPSSQSEDWHIEQVFNILLGLLFCTLNTLKILIIFLFGCHSPTFLLSYSTQSNFNGLVEGQIEMRP